MLTQQQNLPFQYLSNITDFAHIIEGCRRHDRRAQRELYDALAPMAMGVCMRFMRDRDEAQDVMQDGFVRVFENLGQLRDPQQAGAWAYRVMVNECLKYFRRRERPVYTDDVQVDVVQLPLDPFGTEEVVAALQQLAPAQRTAFNLVEVEGYSYEEVAKEMKCTEVNVRALLCRAKSRLKEILRKEK